MKKIYLLVAVATLTLLSCENNTVNDTVNEPILQDATIPEDVLAKINQLGYSTDNIKIFYNNDNELSYVVEGDIMLNKNQLEMDLGQSIIIAEEEHYRMNLVPVFGTSRTSIDRNTGQPITLNRKENIQVALSHNFPAIYWTALQNVVNRYQAVSGLRFNLVASLTDAPGCNPCNGVRNPNITIVPGALGYLGQAEPPYEVAGGRSGGTRIVPGEQIILDINAIGNQVENTIASIIAHEIGHCIGYRHTDWFNRSLSCGFGGREVDEFNIGAVHIPGTPTEENSPGSWMLACIGFNVNRPFTANDLVALRYVHGF